MGILITALMLGLMGSFHCIGMCGPIALSLPLRGDNFGQRITGGLIYNFGRTITYGLMGALFGLIGQSFQLLGFQKWISVIMGSLMISSVLFPFLFNNRFRVNTEFLTSSLRRAIQQLFRIRSYKGLLLIGLGNGLLPCGLVYLAIAGAIGAGNVFLGMAFMICFGLGTLPMMLLISWVGNLFTAAIRNKINKLIPYLVVIIGLIFILRGLTLGIPYLSPPKEKLTPSAPISNAVPASPFKAVNHACCDPK